MAGYLKIVLLHGGIATTQRQKDTLRGLGLRHRHQTRVLKNTPAIRGMVQKVLSLVRFEETESAELPKAPRIETYRLGEVRQQQEKPKKPRKEKPAAAEHEHEKKPAAKHPHKRPHKKKAAAKKGAHHKAAAHKHAAKKKG